MPPAEFTAVTGWGQVYEKAGAPADSNPNATVEVANANTYVHIHATGEWVLAQDQATNPINGGHFVADFSGIAADSNEGEHGFERQHGSRSSSVRI
jgi:hypothetical protein